MTKKNSNLHRAAALLAALCLLASMALPVYAAETETDFSVSNSETIPGDDNTGNGADGTGSDISVSNLETIQKDADTTSEGSKTEPEISVPNSETITNSADTTDKTADAPLTEGVTGSENTAPADNAAADKTADADNTGEDSTGSEDEAGFLNEGDSADDRMITAGNAKESDIALCADNTTVQEGTKYTFYFAPPQSWTRLLEGKTITCSFRRGNDNSNESTNGVRETTAKRTDDSTKDGRPIYQVDVYHNEGNANSLCPYKGFVWVKFTLDNDHWVQMNGERGNNNECWMSVTAIADKCLDGDKLKGSSDETTVSQEYDITKWVDYTSIILKHVRYGKQTMTLLNKSAQALDSVTVTFWEKGDNGEFTQVGVSQPINTLQAGEHADITIPEAACAYVSFQKADGTYIGKQYFNFYNDEDPSDNIAVFPYDPVTRYCLIYKGDNDVRWSAPNSKTVYFDATFSDMLYNNDDAKITYGMPDAKGNLWCYITSDDSSKPAITSQMARDGTSEIWYADVPQGYTQIRFASWEVAGTNTANNGTDTALLTIPDLSKPCFYADTSDDVIYQGGNRGGYWDELGATRDAEKGKKGENGETKSIVELDKQAFTPQSNTKYISTTLYDYYTDYELNGNNRNTYSSNEVNKQRSYVTFEQFDRALSNYYKQYADINKKPINYPLYTGHFQPNIWDNAFSRIASNLNLYGWSTTENDTYWRFIAVNNSAHALDDNHSEGHYKDTFQGLVGNQMVNGMPVMAGTNLAEPHFNEAFLTGTNTEKAVLGKVYKDVSFPFTQDAVFAKNKNDPTDKEAAAKYWYFDSNERSLYLKQDTANSSKYYLEATEKAEKDSSGNPIYTDDNSQNRGSDNSTTDSNNKNQFRGYGFFPFNQKITAENRNVNKYNYGFGVKLQFDFTLTDDGKVQVGDDPNNKVPIKFFFSGDDDVWVYIDGQLVLDVGGAHSKASGLLEFGEQGGKNTVTSYISDIKASNNTIYKDCAPAKQVTFNEKPYTFKHESKDVITYDKGTTHTLTMFYMERGMWESNMAVAFNFPDHNELQVEKKVDVTGVNDLFKKSFQNQKIFTFNIKNLATHYKAKETSYTEGKIQKLPEETYKKAQNPSDTTAKLEYAAELPPESKAGDLAVLWSATRDDPTSAHREQRRGTLPLDSSINIKDFRYLTFDVYVEGNKADTCALGNLYVELWDTEKHQKGCINGKGLQSSDVYGAATGLHPGQWYTIRLLLNSLETTSKDFNNTLQSITVGDNFARKIYLRNFTFRSAPKEQPKSGFTTEQYDIPDYNSATTGKLENATYAVFSSDRGNGDVVDEDGQFLLQDGETVTFKDQFRRGSYIALQEQVDPNLYDTFWTVYENDAPVTNVSGASEYVMTGSVTTLENVKDTAPNDGRTEKVIGGTDKNGDPITNEYSNISMKPKDNTLVFRSYSGTADKDELTKLKVVFTNKVKTGKLIIRKEPAPGESLLNKKFTFTVKFSDVGGQGLGGDILEQEYECTVTEHEDGKEYGKVEIKGIPVGTRFVVSEVAHPETSLQLVTITGGGSDRAVVDGIKARGSVVEDDTHAATATFFNTSRQLIDLEVTKQWQKQDGTTNIPNKELPAAIYLKLQRTKTPEKEDGWVDVDGYGSVMLKPWYDGWVTKFTGLDKFDVKDDPHVNYTYRVLESATADGTFYGGSAGNVIEIDGKKYKILKNTVQVQESSTTPLKLTLTNKLQDAKYNLNITKQDAQDTTKKLGGVEFKLEKLLDKGNLDTQFGENGVRVGLTAESTGLLTFDNLSPGSYRLTETKTAEGYTLLADAIEFELKTDGHCVRDGAGFGNVKYDSAAGVYNIALTINNRKSFELPHTGADAPSLWLLIGLPALVAVLLVLVFRYNKKGGRRQ
ncbi:SpaA isopeptide-forming pilin-related protein [Gemmiger sp.]|uniref:SpaA isopeptide-forming pilin-related protein n=1 Tax=Gemmiger sp. TaxID=2049027 RepID=UPI003FD7B033